MDTEFDFSDPDKKLAAIREKVLMLSFGRLGLFLLMLSLLIVGISEIHWLLFLFFPVSFVFVVLILKFNQEKDRENFYLAVKEMFENRNKRKKRILKGFDSGAEYIDPGHPFASDLDLFGEHSLFQMLNHTVSRGGKSRLANWMKNPLSPLKAGEKQDALLELSKKRHFIFVFEAFGKAFMKKDNGPDTKGRFYSWLSVTQQWHSFYFLPMILGPIIGLIVLFGTLYGLFSTLYLSIFVLIGIGLLGLPFKPLMEAMKALPNASDLKTLQAWARLLEKEQFKHPLLLKYQSPVKHQDFLASKALKQLESLTFLIQNRTNMLYLIFNILFWTDFYVLYRLKKWNKIGGQHMKNWEDTFDDWEALVSLSSFMEEEQLTTKVVWEKNFTLAGTAIKHPLILQETCVPNNFSLMEGEKVILLTGSNMSGKTTFMRTLGINLVLAGMGISPFARSFHTGPFLLYTSMRNTDSLGESVSSFYAELARIKGVLEKAASGKPVFYLLDEILKGTNTADRILGSEALIRQLAKSQAKGIISTHDIELSTLEAQLPFLVNYSFHHEIQKDEIVFDYTIKEGPCPNFNAQKLMELMGIKIEDLN
jgi:hypothetical protein